jgi:hypothetical protein
MSPAERLQTIQDLIYLVRQMVLAERRIDLAINLVFVFYYNRWTSRKTVRLTQDEERFFADAMLEPSTLNT